MTRSQRERSLYGRLSAERAVTAPVVLHRTTLTSLVAAVEDVARSGGTGGLLLARVPSTQATVTVVGGDGAAPLHVPWPRAAADEWFMVVTGGDYPLALCAQPTDDDEIDALCSTEPRIAELAADLVIETLATVMEELPSRPRVAATPTGSADNLIIMLLQRIDDAERRAHEASSQVVAAVERDRVRIARGLHDGPVQELTAARLFLDGATHTDDAVDRNLLERGMQTLQSATTACRQLMDRLTPAMTDPGELRMRIERWLPWVADASAVDIAVNVPARLERTHSGLLFDAVRCIDKLIENVVRHAQGRLVRVHVTADDDAMTVVVADAGQGGAPASPTPGASGLGLLTRRVHNRGGTVTVKSESSGTAVTVTMPVRAADGP